MKLSEEQLTELEVEIKVLRKQLAGISDGIFLMGDNGKVFDFKFSQLDDLLSDVRTLWKALARLMTFDQAMTWDSEANAWKCKFCDWLTHSEHAPDCPWTAAKKLLEVR